MEFEQENNKKESKGATQMEKILNKEFDKRKISYICEINQKYS